MRVLHVDTALEWRGGQVQLLSLLEGAGEHALAAPTQAPLARRARDLGIPVLPIAARGVRAAWTLRRVARAFAPDLIAAHSSRAHGLALLAGPPVVVHRRVDFRPSLLSGPKYRSALGFVAVSHAVRKVLQAAGVPERRVEVVWDGVAPPPLEPAALDFGPGPIFGALGALVPHKGHRVLVEAMQGVPGTLVLLGEGPLRAALAGQARRLGVDLRLPGWRADARAVLPHLRCFVHPSLEEGFGQAVAEAMWAGVPVVVSDAGGLPEVVADTATVVPKGDPEALRRALQGPLPDPRRARERARTVLTVKAMVEGTLSAYDRLVG